MPTQQHVITLSWVQELQHPVTSVSYILVGLGWGAGVCMVRHSSHLACQ